MTNKSQTSRRLLDTGDKSEVGRERDRLVQEVGACDLVILNNPQVFEI
jgi:hypothetical protein